MAAEALTEKKHLSDYLSDLFILAASLKLAKDLGSPEGLRSKIVDMFGKADRETKDAGIADEVFQQARYALAGFLDEMILSSSWIYKDQWSARPIQYEFFRENVAGVEFFNRMDTIRRTLPVNTDLLEIYYLCLIMGFEGKYKIHDREKLKELVEDVGKEILERRHKVSVLSPHGRRPDELIETVKQGLPAWVVIVSTIAIIFFFYITLSFMVSHEANSMARTIQQSGEAVR